MATRTLTATPTAIPPTATATSTPTVTTQALAIATPVASNQRPYSTTLQVLSAGQGTQTVVVHYLLYLPREYGQDPQREWPLILFLHGSYERGDDPTVLTRQGLPKLLEQQADFPCIVASPQCPANEFWWPRTHILGAFLDHIQSAYSVDAQRIYLTGISMGGYGAWALALRYPQRFAALVPIAGGADFQGNEIPKNICNLKDLPVWAFHGKQDDNVPYSESENAVKALQECGGNARLTLYPDANHAGAWERAYVDPELYAWVMRQKR